MTEITDLNPISTVADADELVIYDVSLTSSNTKKIRKDTFLAGVALDGGDHDFGTSEITNLTTSDATLGFSGAATLTSIKKATGTVSPADIAAGASETVTLTLTGAVTTDHLTWNIAQALPDGMTCQAWISAADTVSIKFHNTTASLIAGASYAAMAMAHTFA